MPDGKILAFTGLRPYELPWLYDETAPACSAVRAAVLDRLIKLIEEENVRRFISGMAMGIEQICAELAVYLKGIYPGITLEAAIPYREQDILWPQNYRARYRRIISQCEYIHITREEYADGCIETHNRYIAEKCDILLAVWHGRPSGEQSILGCAKKLGKRIIRISPLISGERQLNISLEKYL